MARYPSALRHPIQNTKTIASTSANACALCRGEDEESGLDSCDDPALVGRRAEDEHQQQQRQAFREDRDVVGDKRRIQRDAHRGDETRDRPSGSRDQTFHEEHDHDAGNQAHEPTESNRCPEHPVHPR